MYQSSPKIKRKTRSDKFPLTLHSTGQYCKKIKGKLYYLGSDKEQALEQALARYLEAAETVQALKEIPEKGELVFHTRIGNPWVRAIRSVDEDGTEKYVKDDSVSKEFSKDTEDRNSKTKRCWLLYSQKDGSNMDR